MTYHCSEILMTCVKLADYIAIVEFGIKSPCNHNCKH